MPRRLSYYWVALGLLSGVASLSAICWGQDVNLSIKQRVPALGSARSNPIDAAPKETLAVRAVVAGEVVAAIFIYDEVGDLVAKNNEEDSSAFEWEVPAVGKYTIVIYNNADTALDYVITKVPPAPIRAPDTAKPSYAVVPVFWATTRNLAGRRPVKFDSELSTEKTTTYGVSQVSIPRDHLMGNLEGPSILKLEFRADPEKHIVLLSSEVSTAARFFADLSKITNRTDEKQALVFVHGFNTTFDDGIRRTAQLSYDLGFKGPAISFSWPSQGELGPVSYNKDRRNAELSAGNLRQFLHDVVLKAGVARVNVIAHSMGSFALVQALANAGAEGTTIQQVALVAPDIDAEVFRQLADQFKKASPHTTLYASSRDFALTASQQYSGYPRAGQGAPNIVVVNGIDTVDASSVDTSLIGVRHQYYADNSQILSDLFWLFKGHPADKRFGLRAAHARGGLYWIFNPTAR